jgi:hypothetical protein
MDKVAAYNVDRPHTYDSLVIIEVTSESMNVYHEDTEDDIGISYTKPVFLGRFKRVLHDGTIDKQSNCLNTSLSKGSKIALFPDTTIGLVIDGSYYTFGLEGTAEVLINTEFPVEFLGEHGEFVSMSEEGFIKYMNSFKVKRMSSSSKDKNYDYILHDEDEYFDDEIDEGLRF